MTDFTLTEKPKLSFGIEIEFLAVHNFPEPETEEEGSAHEIAGRRIYERLNAAGIPATGHESLDLDINHDAHIPSYSRWTVEQDDSLSLTEEETDLLLPGWAEEPIELSSRVFDFYNDNWRAEIAAVLEILRSIEGPNCRLITNKSTGFHIHVGFGEQGIPFRVAKNVFQFLTAFEQQVDQIHLLERVKRCEQYNMSLSQAHKAQYPWNGERGQRFRTSQKIGDRMLDNLFDIETLKTWTELEHFFWIDISAEQNGSRVVDGHSSVVNFDNLHSSGKSGRVIGTIEFRQHAGTIDYFTISSWILLTSTLVQYSATAPAAEFLQLLLRGLEQNYSLRQLLDAIHCPQDAMDFYCTDDGPIGVLPFYNTPLAATPRTTALSEYIEEDYDIRSKPHVLANAIAAKSTTHKFPISIAKVARAPPAIDVKARLEKHLMKIPQYERTGTATEAHMDFARECVLSELACRYWDGHKEPDEASMLRRLTDEEGATWIRMSKW